MKAARQRAILQLVSRERLSSQREIRARLAGVGVEATQSTISRDIEELGLARVHDQQGVRYVAPGAMNGDETAGGDGPRRVLRRLLQSYALSMAVSGNLLVIQTPPAAAHLLGEGIDRSDVENIVGTVAGDNTVLVVAREGVHTREIERALNDIMKESGS